MLQHRQEAIKSGVNISPALLGRMKQRRREGTDKDGAKETWKGSRERVMGAPDGISRNVEKRSVFRNRRE